MDDWAGFGSETEFEEYIRELLLLANSPEALGLTGEPEPKSPRFQERERRMLADPFGYARKVLRPMWRKVLTTAACLMLAVTVAFGGLMAASPTARAWVSRIVTEWYEGFTRFQFSGEDSNEALPWKLNYLPDGFEKIEEDGTAGYWTVVYQSQEGCEIVVEITPIMENTHFDADNEHRDYQKIEINGDEGYLLTGTSPGVKNILVCRNTESQIQVMIVASIDTEELTKIAENIESLEEKIF